MGPEEPIKSVELPLREEIERKFEKLTALLETNKKNLEDTNKTLRKCLVAFSALQAHTHSADGKAVLSVGILNEAVFNS